MIDNADEPDNLTFGICWQHNQDDEFEFVINKDLYTSLFDLFDICIINIMNDSHIGILTKLLSIFDTKEFLKIKIYKVEIIKRLLVRCAVSPKKLFDNKNSTCFV